MVLTKDQTAIPATGIRGMSKVIFVEDAHIIRAALVEITNVQPDYRVVGQAGDGALGLELYKKFDPDVVVTNISMPIMDGLTLTRKIMEYNPKAKVMILSSQGTKERIQQGLQAGARLHVTKPLTEKDFLKALRAVASGDPPQFESWG